MYSYTDIHQQVTRRRGWFLWVVYNGIEEPMSIAKR
jgi:hypothetical protein